MPERPDGWVHGKAGLKEWELTLATRLKMTPAQYKAHCVEELKKSHQWLKEFKARVHNKQQDNDTKDKGDSFAWLD